MALRKEDVSHFTYVNGTFSNVDKLDFTEVDNLGIGEYGIPSKERKFF